MALPALTRTIDDAFTHTWYEIRAEAIDNILEANVVTAALKMKGCFVPQVGGEYITRTLRYGQKTATNVKKGDSLTSGETEITTMGRWNWAYISSHVQRSMMDDQKNSGKFRIRSLVNTKTMAARDALNTAIETNLFAAVNTGGTAAEIKEMRLERDPNSLFNLMPGSTEHGAGGNYHDSASYSFGNVTFDNSWWRTRYLTAVDPPEVNLLSQLKNLYNTCTNNQASPDLILTTQTLFEIYEEFALDVTQIVKGEAGLADLGYETLKFKGKDMVYSSNATSGSVTMLNTNHIEIVYDPNLWFEMTEWKYIALQTERIAHIILTMQLVSDQLRRHGYLGVYT